MTIARRSHLFPSRTQKLSSLAPMILGGKLPGKVGRCRFFYFLENVKMTTFTVRLTIARSAGNVSPFRKVHVDNYAASETSPDVFLCHKYGSYLMAPGLPIYRFTPFGYFRRKCVNTVDPPRCKMNETCISMGEHSRYALP